MPAKPDGEKTNFFPSKLIFALGAALFVLAAWVFAELADDAVPGNYLELETKIMRSFRHPDDLSRGLGPPEVTLAMRDITALGSTTVLTLVVALVLGFLFLCRRYRAALLILTATLSGTIIGSSAKNIIDRDRPQIVPHLTEVSSKSFPSGHSMMSSVVYLTLGALLAQTTARRREKVYVIAAACLLTVLIGMTRVYLGVHYPTDVVAGWAAGVAWALLCWGIAWWLQRHGQLRHPEASSDKKG
ncbi:MAG: phosphatase PAP2 family protein [Opitutaceae bacterium]